MIKEFVRYELAVKLKELGFDKKCFCNWEESWSPEPEHEIRMVLTTDQTWLRPGWVRAPTFSQAFKWFREKNQLDTSINTVYSKYNDTLSKKYSGVIDDKSVFTNIGFYDTYEEVELACLDKLIEIAEGIKSKK